LEREAWALFLSAFSWESLIVCGMSRGEIGVFSGEKNLCGLMLHGSYAHITYHISQRRKLPTQAIFGSYTSLVVFPPLLGIFYSFMIFEEEKITG